MIHGRTPDNFKEERLSLLYTLEVVFDGEVFRPIEPLEMLPDTRVRIVVELPDSAAAKKLSFLQTARSLRLSGPPDWSEKIEEYLYGDKTNEQA